jgi:MFS family permease
MLHAAGGDDAPAAAAAAAPTLLQRLTTSPLAAPLRPRSRRGAYGALSDEAEEDDEADEPHDAHDAPLLPPPYDSGAAASAHAIDDDDGGGGAEGDGTLWDVLRALLLPLYVPMLLLFFAWGLVTPILPLYASALGAGPAAVGAVAAARAVGSLAATLPAGAAVQRLGVRAATLGGVAAYCIACGWGAVAAGIPSLAASRVLAGAGYSLYSLAQQTLVRLRVPPRFRGRVLASVGGTYRVGGLLAPLLGGVLAQHAGFRAVFAAQLAACAPALPLIALSLRRDLAPPPPEHADAAAAGAAADADDANADAASASAQLRAYLCAHWRPMGAAYAATLLMSVVRSVRDLVLPLASAQAGLTRAATGYVTATSYAGDTLLFPLGGFIMDRRGVGVAGAASCSVMAAGLLLLARPRAGVVALFTAAAVTGIGNGLSSGIVMALGADMAPAHLAGAVLSTFNFVAALGGVAGPLICGALAQAAGLRAAAGAAAAIATAGALWWELALPRMHDGGGDDGDGGWDGGMQLAVLGGGGGGGGSGGASRQGRGYDGDSEGAAGGREALLALPGEEGDAEGGYGRGGGGARTTTLAHAPHAARQ